MLLFAVGQRRGGWRKALLMLLLLLLLQLPGLQGLLTSDGVREPKVNRFILAKKTALPDYLWANLVLVQCLGCQEIKSIICIPMVLAQRMTLTYPN